MTCAGCKYYTPCLDAMCSGQERHDPYCFLRYEWDPCGCNEREDDVEGKF